MLINCCSLNALIILQGSISFSGHFFQLWLFSPVMPFDMAEVRQISGIETETDEMRMLSKIKSEWSTFGDVSLHRSFLFHWFIFSPFSNAGNRQ